MKVVDCCNLKYYFSVYSAADDQVIAKKMRYIIMIMINCLPEGEIGPS